MKKVIIALLFIVFLVGCTKQVSETYRKQTGLAVGDGSPQIQEYVIQENEILEYREISYARDESFLEALEVGALQDNKEKFGKKAITIDKMFDKDEQLYKLICTIDYSKIDDDILQSYIEINGKPKHLVLTIDDISNFDAYEKTSD